MSRSTQFIGLTKKAEKFVAKFEPLDDPLNTTFGMFEEIIPLRSWKHPEKGVVREVVQETPWSSGPMIFTCLAWDFGNTVEIVDGEDKFVRDNSNTIFEWIHNPAVRDMEFNPETGECWV